MSEVSLYRKIFVADLNNGTHGTFIFSNPAPNLTQKWLELKKMMKCFKLHEYFNIASKYHAA